jgi:DNA-binding SARP family transcriptional activator
MAARSTARGGVASPLTMVRPAALQLDLLDGFALHLDGLRTELPPGAQRLLALVALSRRAVHRSHLAGRLWPESTERRAAANLRSALWRVNQACTDLILATTDHVLLRMDVAVDVRDLESLAYAILDENPPAAPFARMDAVLRADVLPDWTDEWVLVERERIHQLRLHALEALCAQRSSTGQFGHAVHFGLTAVAADPFRESAHRAVIGAYLAEGNRRDAVRQFNNFRRLLLDELGVEPSAQLAALVGVPSPRAAGAWPAGLDGLASGRRG